MSQIYSTPQSTDYASAALAVTIPNALEALRTSFSGASAPSLPAPLTGQLWADTSTGWLKVRDVAGTGWVKVARLAADLVLQLSSQGWSGALNASKTDWLASVPRVGQVRRLVLVSDTASTSSSGNEWQFQLVKYPAAAPGSPVNLFSGTVGTFTALGGVGGGAEFVADAALVLTPDQNATVADLDQIELVVTKVGSATNLANFRAILEVD